ncbi:AraC family transcriptional regulator [Pseudomaricurvus alkylphenolicus]|uniref:AraC family transcriptional regulator n=1 Tax=Pseudomaricurvus alkylphenolicus TaxID=1306991 RepID=UPI001423DC80|nr:AraC family transcriptional regulator [Pseudomaricurvus alkylphenolicus]NIB44620.1 AraC family transcriptional regulator [Pseudomaricurvus alkylphenolicus]
MQLTSNWPLPDKGIRFLTPQFLCDQLSLHALTQGLFPVAMGYYPKAEKHHMVREQHSNNLMIYCTSGRGTLMLEGKTYRIRSGDLILLPEGLSHSYSSHSRYPWSIYWIHYEGQLCEEFHRHLDTSGPVQAIGMQPRLISDFEELFRLRHSGYNLASFVHGCHQLQQIMSHLALLVRQRRSQTGKQIDLDAARAYMNEHLHGQLNLDSLAAHSKLSKYHFSKRFKALTGHSPIQFFINLKMQHACYLLDSSTQSVKQVAASLGYDDAYYFSRLFKKVIGLSPDQYRKSKHR